MPGGPQAPAPTQMLLGGHVPWPVPWQQIGHCTAEVVTHTPLQHLLPNPPLQSRAVWLFRGAVPHKLLTQVWTRQVGGGTGHWFGLVQDAHSLYPTSQLPLQQTPEPRTIWQVVPFSLSVVPHVPLVHTAFLHGSDVVQLLSCRHCTHTPLALQNGALPEQ
jgi:hypothetical protein